MPQRKHKPEEIVAKLRQVDVLLLRGDVSGRLDTVLVDIQQGTGA